MTLSASSAFFGGLCRCFGAGANFRVSSPGLVNFVNSIGAGSALASPNVDGGGLPASAIWCVRARDLCERHGNRDQHHVQWRNGFVPEFA